MRRAGRDPELRVQRMGLRARFVLAMTGALILVLVPTAWLIHAGAERIAENERSDALRRAVHYTWQGPPYEERGPHLEHPGGVRESSFQARDGTRGTLLVYGREPESELRLLVPEAPQEGTALPKLLFAITALVVVAGALVALWVASQVTRPVQRLVDDVRQIAKGDLAHRTHPSGPGEIALLARSIDRMTRDLAGAREAEIELSMRERELELAAGVREALLPLATPLVPGYDPGACFLAARQFGGDFHGYVERPDGRVGLFVCDVSGIGVPAALVGATARSYLGPELEERADELEALRRVNRWLADDVRRGMYVTVLYVGVDPGAGVARVVSAGHRLPLLRYSAADGHLRTVHPDGIALGFDRGPVFERRLEALDVPVEPGDRLLLANSATVTIAGAAGGELGEKGFYQLVRRHARLDTAGFLRHLRRDLERVAGEERLARDVSLVTIAREVRSSREVQS